VGTECQGGPNPRFQIFVRIPDILRCFEILLSSSRKIIKQCHKLSSDIFQHSFKLITHLVIRSYIKVHPRKGHEGPEGQYRYSSTLSLMSALEEDGSTPRPLYPVPIVQEAGWAQGPVWTSAENLTPTGIRFPGRQAAI
jgi:hypothetical protein